MPTEREYRREMIAVCQRVYQKGFVASNDGNLAIKLNENRFLVTPTGFSKGDLTESDLLICDAEGKKIAGKHSVTSEIYMHLRAFKLRADLRASIHAHPTYATAFSLSSVSLADCILPEIILTFGSIPLSEYAQPASTEGADIIEDLIKDYDVILIDRHGSFTAGKDIWDAYYKLERLEHAAEITYHARMLGPVRHLPGAEMAKLIERGVKSGINPATLSTCSCNSPVPSRAEEKAETISENKEMSERQLIESITREVIKSL